MSVPSNICYYQEFGMMWMLLPLWVTVQRQHDWVMCNRYSQKDWSWSTGCTVLTVHINNLHFQHVTDKRSRCQVCWCWSVTLSCLGQMSGGRRQVICGQVRVDVGMRWTLLRSQVLLQAALEMSKHTEFTDEQKLTFSGLLVIYLTFRFRFSTNCI